MHDFLIVHTWHRTHGINFVFWPHLALKDLMLLMGGICGFPEPPVIPQLYWDGGVGAPFMSYDDHNAQERPQPPSEHIGQL